jgi:hypothetical protein
VDIPGVYAPQMIWRRTLRQLLYATLSVFPEAMVDLTSIRADQDDPLIRWLKTLQERLPMADKMIPTEAFRAAICELTLNGASTRRAKPLAGASGSRSPEELARIELAERKWGFLSPPKQRMYAAIVSFGPVTAGSSIAGETERAQRASDS